MLVVYENCVRDLNILKSKFIDFKLQNMAFSHNRDGRHVEWFELFGRLGVTTAGYPFEYVKVLIQIGHEPIPPKPAHTLLGKPALVLPGVFTYIRHIKKVDGFFGLYRGLLPKLCSNFFSGFTYTIILERLPALDVEVEDEGQEDILTEDQKVVRFAHRLCKETAARCTAIIASHPLHVIAIRTMAQFIGREEKYGGIFGSFFEVYHQDGILGFFAGMCPRIVNEVLTLWLASTVSFLINTYVVEEKTLKGYVKAFTLYLSSALFYPFAVVSTVMAVNNCGLAAGLPPNMPVYSNWTDCWSHLSAIGQLKRGSSILWRYYRGPYIPSNVYGSNEKSYGRSEKKFKY